jgi:hypothetical protein
VFREPNKIRDKICHSDDNERTYNAEEASSWMMTFVALAKAFQLQEAIEKLHNLTGDFIRFKTWSKCESECECEFTSMYHFLPAGPDLNED